LRRQERLALGIGWRVYLLRLLGIAYNSIDRVLLAAWTPGIQVSRYDAANRVHGLALLPLSLPGQFISPIAARLAGAKRYDTLAEFWGSGTVLLSAATVPLVLGLMSCADALMDLWLNGRLPGIASLTFVYLLNVLVFVIPQVGWSIAIGMGRASALTPPAVVGVLTNVVVSAVLVLLGYGPMGVVVGTIIGNGAAMVLYMRRFAAVIRFPWQVVTGNAVRRVYLPSLLTIAPAAFLVRSATDVDALRVVGSMAATVVAFLIVAQRCRRELELVRRVLNPGAAA
jgi:O-antigen/teichoic acid export membrane protein